MIASSRTSLSESSRTMIGTLWTPALWAARQRRSPATISNALRVLGMRADDDRLDKTPWRGSNRPAPPSSASAKSLRGLNRPLRRCSIGHSRCSPSCGARGWLCGTSPIRDASPRPRRLFGSAEFISKPTSQSASGNSGKRFPARSTIDEEPRTAYAALFCRSRSMISVASRM